MMALTAITVELYLNLLCIVGIYFMMALTLIRLLLNLLCIVGIYFMMALTLIRTILEPSLYCRNLLHDGAHTH